MGNRKMAKENKVEAGGSNIDHNVTSAVTNNSGSGIITNAHAANATTAISTNISGSAHHTTEEEIRPDDYNIEKSTTRTTTATKSVTGSSYKNDAIGSSKWVLMG